MNIVTSIAFILGILIVGILPFPVLYWFSNFLGFILHRIARYRRGVVESNLAMCFPEFDGNHRKRVVKYFYRNLSDNILEGVKVFTMGQRQVLKRHKLLNPELVLPYLNDGISVIGVTGHYANWEWGSLSASLQIQTNVIAFYKKINNPFIDKLVRKSRAKYGTTLVTLHNTSEAFEANVSKPSIFLMAADQRTIRKSLPKAYRVNFFNRETPFLHGPEKYSRLYNIPVIYIDIQRVKRGFYEITLSVLADDPKTLPDGEITKRYAQKLEEIVRAKPQDWLWSHKRWKAI